AAGATSPAEVAEALLVDQQQRWKCGQRIPAAAYLQGYPALQADGELALDLIWSEFLLREDLGERPDLEEYLRAYPAYGTALRRQHEVHRGLPPSRAAETTGAGPVGTT